MYAAATNRPLAASAEHVMGRLAEQPQARRLGGQASEKEVALVSGRDVAGHSSSTEEGRSETLPKLIQTVIGPCE